ncbi:MAG: DUF4080 domain-containing protein [Treponema sp.]|jgi:hypothetical protein|nr:DUF4080 domain-containing protein [Treponema sp.]
MPSAQKNSPGENRPLIILTTINAKWIHPSLALRLLKANLGEWEDRAEILEFALRQPLEEKTGPILAAAPRILGISVSIWNHRASLELLLALKRAWEGNPDGGDCPLKPAGTAPAGGQRPLGRRPLIILGGPEAAYLPEETELLRHADWVLRGEGEVFFRDFVALVLGEKGDLEGRSFRTGDSEPEPGAGLIRGLPSVKQVRGKIIEARPLEPASLDPGYRLYTQEDLHRKLLYVEASRGCPFGCQFCLSSLDRQVREFPLEAFLGEMEALLDRGARTFKFLDRTFNLNIGQARRILEFFLDRLRPSLCVHFEMVPGRFPPELREILPRFPPGSLRLEVGIQTFNPETAALIGRSSDPEGELEVLRFLREGTHAIVHADLIAGLPGEDLASFAQGFDRLWAVRPTEIQPGILKRLPGTPLSRQDKDWDMVYSPQPPYEVLETAVLPVRDLDRLKNFARFWELIVNRGAFPDLAPALFPEGKPVFGPFMALSDWLLERFGRNWGIDRKELRAALEERQ